MKKIIITGIIMLFGMFYSCNIQALETAETENKSYLKCVYNIPSNSNITIELNYTASDDKIVIKTINKNASNSNGNISTGNIGAVNVNVTSSNLTNSERKLYCPTLYFTTASISGTAASYQITSNKQTNKFKELQLDTDKSTIYNAEGEVNKFDSCVYWAGDYEVKYNGNMTSQALTYNVFNRDGKFHGTFNIDRNDFTFNEIFKEGKCSTSLKLWVTCEDSSYMTKTCKITKQALNGNSQSGDKQLIPDSSTGKPDDPNYVPGISIDSSYGCGFLDDLNVEFKKIFDTIKLLLIGALIALTILDFIKALASGNDDGTKKAWKNFMIRVGIVVMIFLLPLLIEIVLGIFFGGGFDACLGKF